MPHPFLQTSEADFEPKAIELFKTQMQEVKVLSDYASLLKFDLKNVRALNQILFLPISFFKTHQVIRKNQTPDFIFESSGTSGMERSKHFVSDISIYHQSLEAGFRLFVGDPIKFIFLALLPSYLEQKHSSLVYMVERLMKLGGDPQNEFFKTDYARLNEILSSNQASDKNILLFGVSYALLDFAEQFPRPFQNLTVIETGGMKGRREETTREELHRKLSAAFGLKKIHSEYGMTELLSQAWSARDGLYRCPPWMKVMARDLSDPFSLLPVGKQGALNVIDLANQNSCAFIATEDIGIVHEDGSFEVMGRMDASDLRGCNLLLEN